MLDSRSPSTPSGGPVVFHEDEDASVLAADIPTPEPTTLWKKLHKLGIVSAIYAGGNAIGTLGWDIASYAPGHPTLRCGLEGLASNLPSIFFTYAAARVDGTHYAKALQQGKPIAEARNIANKQAWQDAFKELVIYLPKDTFYQLIISVGIALAKEDFFKDWELEADPTNTTREVFLVLAVIYVSIFSINFPLSRWLKSQETRLQAFINANKASLSYCMFHLSWVAFPDWDTFNDAVKSLGLATLFMWGYSFTAETLPAMLWTCYKHETPKNNTDIPLLNLDGASDEPPLQPVADKTSTYQKVAKYIGSFGIWNCCAKPVENTQRVVRSSSYSELAL